MGDFLYREALERDEQGTSEHADTLILCIIFQLGGSSRVQHIPTGRGNNFRTRPDPFSENFPKQLLAAGVLTV